MGLIEMIRGDRVYLDSNVFIYALEGFPEYSALLESSLRRLTPAACAQQRAS